ncbi:hypothetical protein Tco_1164806 [Tanacetum coccineum]
MVTESVVMDVGEFLNGEDGNLVCKSNVGSLVVGHDSNIFEVDKKSDLSEVIDTTKDSKILVELSKEEDKDNHSLVGNFIVDSGAEKNGGVTLVEKTAIDGIPRKNSSRTGGDYKSAVMNIDHALINFSRESGNGNNNLVENNEECVVEQNDKCKNLIDNFVETCWLSGKHSNSGDDKLYQQRKRMEDLEKDTKGFTHVVSQFDMCKWPTRKKIVVDGSSKIQRGNELKTKFAREGIKYEMGDWVYLKLQPYMQVSVSQSHLPKSMIHFKGWLKLEKLFINWSCWKLLKMPCVFYVSKLRKWKGHVTGMGALTVCEDGELSAVEPQMILARRMHKRDNKIDVYVLVQCVKDNVVADATLV